MKKLFPENRVTRKGLLEFLDKKGFYIVLVLCIAIIAATAVFVTSHNLTSSNDAEKIIPDDVGEGTIAEAGANQPEQTIGDAANFPAGTQASADAGKAVQPVQKTAATDKTASTGKQPVKAATPSKTQSPAKATPKDANFIAPVFGQVTFEFAKDKLVYSKTLEEWRVHTGVDLAAERGTTVKAVAEGVISRIINDPKLGVTIEIDHKNGLKTVYANLASDEMVTPNQKVKKGDIIGCVGNTAMFESAEESHLHFEVLKDNIEVDPTVYLPKK